MSKLAKCGTCATMRCCPEHCCNWDDCSCKDCEMCGGTMPLEYSKKELEDFANQQKELEKKKLEEEENLRLQKKKEAEEQRNKEKMAEASLSVPVKTDTAQNNLQDKNEFEYVKDEKYLKTMAMIEETQKKNQSTLDKLSDTINQLNTTIKDIKQLSHNYDAIKEGFNRTMVRIVENLGAHLAPHKRMPGPGEEHMTPIVSNVNLVTDELISKKHIVVLTGAGLSAASNIPTFRGEGGFWTLRNKDQKIQASEFLTHQYFTNSPEEVWQWHHELRRAVLKNSANVSHHALAKLQAFCKRSNIKLTMVTQNIDGYHTDALGKALREQTDSYKKVNTQKHTSFDGVEEKKTSDAREDSQTTNRCEICHDIYEIHGNIHFMRCENECTLKLFPSPEANCPDDFVPKCPNCKGIARPHTLFFDESYKEEYYRGQSLLQEIDSMDCLLVIGTALETNLACNIVAKAINKSALIVEVNPEPCIQFGNVRYLLGFAEEFLPNICEDFQKKANENKK